MLPVHKPQATPPDLCRPGVQAPPLHEPVAEVPVSFVWQGCRCCPGIGQIGLSHVQARPLSRNAPSLRESKLQVPPLH